MSLNFKLDSLCLEKKLTNKELSLKKVFNNFRKAFGLPMQKRSLIIKEIKYNNYINVNEIISSIMGTKYHSDENLNSLFQIRAINYIINNNSYFFNFINELYKALYYYNMHDILESGDIKESFTIKIMEGKKLTQDHFNILHKKLEEKNKKVSEKKDNKNKPTTKELITNIFPFSSTYRLNGKIYKPQIFNIYKHFRKKTSFTRTNKFINVYDLIFTIKLIDSNNIITMEKNDICEILKPYSEGNIFNSLLNQNFSFKTEEETNVDMTPIQLYLKNKIN